MSTTSLDDILLNSLTKTQPPAKEPDPAVEVTEDVSRETLENPVEVNEPDEYGASEEAPPPAAKVMDEYGNEKAPTKVYTEDEVNDRINSAIRDRLARMERNHSPAPTQQQAQQAASGFEYNAESKDTWQAGLNPLLSRLYLRCLPSKPTSHYKQESKQRRPNLSLSLHKACFVCQNNAPRRKGQFRCPGLAAGLSLAGEEPRTRRTVERREKTHEIGPLRQAGQGKAGAHRRGRQAPRPERSDRRHRRRDACAAGSRAPRQDQAGEPAGGARRAANRPFVANVGNFVAVGLNYADHAAEQGLAIPKEPVLFIKARTCIVGPYDDIVIPKGSEKTDWEVELGVVIGTRASYVSEKDALAYVAGYCVVNDVSERDYQHRRGGGQWTKGKGCPASARSVHGW